MLKGKKILIGITGSIAAYKIPLLIRFLVKDGAEVKVILTHAAKDFVTPLTLSTLSGNPVLSDFFKSDDGIWNSHVDLGNWADVFLISPASATTMGKMAGGIADNLLVATYLAAKCPVFVAPAMDVDMFRHLSTQKNIELLRSRGNTILEPEVGELASGLSGPGRLQEPEKMLKALKDHFSKKKRFEGIKVLVTAGPTNESIDPVRYIGNHSSGKMGYAIAENFAVQGAHVQLISGPVSINIHHPLISLTQVTTASEMAEVCFSKAKDANIIVMAAAVADYTPEKPEPGKIKKGVQNIAVSLKRTVDILKTLGEKKPKGQLLVGFALETDNELENASHKLKNKNLDLIVLNSLKDDGAGFGYNTNNVVFIDRKGKIKRSGLKSKTEIAEELVNLIDQFIKSKKG